MLKARVKVQTWSCVESVVEVEGLTERELREKALVAHRTEGKAKGHITKNKTTILELKEGPSEAR